MYNKKIPGELGEEGRTGGLGEVGGSGRARNQGQGSSACDLCWPQEVSMLPTDTDPSFPHHSGSKTLTNKIYVKITIITMQFRKGSELFS